MPLLCETKTSYISCPYQVQQGYLALLQPAVGGGAEWGADKIRFGVTKVRGLSYANLRVRVSYIDSVWNQT